MLTLLTIAGVLTFTAGILGHLNWKETTKLAKTAENYNQFINRNQK